jgi:GNAT superfamily N-acetyltransferase
MRQFAFISTSHPLPTNHRQKPVIGFRFPLISGYFPAKSLQYRSEPSGAGKSRFGNPTKIRKHGDNIKVDLYSVAFRQINPLIGSRQGIDRDDRFRFNRCKTDFNQSAIARTAYAKETVTIKSARSFSAMAPDPAITVTRGYIPGAIGRIAELHGTYYANHWGFGLFFEAKVATELSAFLKAYDPDRDALWVATIDGRVEGGIVIDGTHAADSGAHLRWFILSDTLRGKGMGRQLINRAVDFCMEKAYRRIYLWTFEGLDVARHLYESVGFNLTRQQKGAGWGIKVNEQMFECTLLDV